jgi:hypothetical protein
MRIATNVMVMCHEATEARAHLLTDRQLAQPRSRASQGTVSPSQSRSLHAQRAGTTMTRNRASRKADQRATVTRRRHDGNHLALMFHPSPGLRDARSLQRHVATGSALSNRSNWL